LRRIDTLWYNANMESIKGMLLRRFSLILCMVCFAFPLVAKGSREQASPPRPELSILDTNNTLVVAIDPGEDLITMDPRFATDSNSVLVASSVSKGLCDYDPRTAMPIPELADSWTVSPDGLVWEFTLRRGIRFSDGTPITATDFIESWLSSFEASKDRTSFASLLDIVQGIEEWRKGIGSLRKIALEAVGSDRLRIKLNSPAPYLPMILCNVGFSVVHPEVRNGTAAAGKISSGPYLLREASEDRLVLERNPYYWNAASSRCDYLEIDMRGETEAVYEAYRNGDIQWAQMFIPREYQTGGDLFFSPQFSTSFFYFSAASGPYADPKVRKALYAMVDWDEIRRIGSQPFPTETLVPGSDVRPTRLPTSPLERKALALGLLQEAGYPDATGLPPLIMAVHRGSQVATAAERIAETWSDQLHLTVILDTVPLTVYANHPEQSPYHFACLTWIGDYYDPSAFLTMWTSDSTFNLGNYENETYDALVHSALATMEPQARHLMLSTAEQYLLDERTVIPTSNSFSINFVRTDLIDGWYDNPLNIHPIQSIGRI